MKKNLYIIIFILILFPVYMRFRGIFWGLPSETMCLRSFASDKGYTISSLKNMKPNKLDFDGDDSEFKYLSFRLDGAALYGGAAMMKLFDILGIAKIYNNRDYYEKHLEKEDYLYIPVRLFICIVGILTIFFVYLTGKELYDNFIGILAALIFSFNFMHIKHSFILDNHIMMIFFVLYELIENKKTGMKAKFREPEPKSIKYLIEHPAEALKIAKNGYNKVYEVLG